jgi:GNAT superfamily N-acetyltransferase
MDSPFSIRSAGLEDIPTIGYLAQRIWPSTYANILSSQQLEYMIQLIYSPDSLSRQMVEDKHLFFILEDADEAVGFASYSRLPDSTLFKLHKIYVSTDRQGKGLGRLLIDFILEEVGQEGATALRLNVNRHNRARQFYEKLGFAVIGQEDIDIGQGFFMNDYVMEKKLLEY